MKTLHPHSSVGIRQEIQRATGRIPWKWMAGATAAIGAGTVSARPVQLYPGGKDITIFAGNRLTAEAGFLDADLTGDGLDDLANMMTEKKERAVSTVGVSYTGIYRSVQVRDGLSPIGSARFVAKEYSAFSFQEKRYFAAVDNVPGNSTGMVPHTKEGRVFVIFSDYRINNGATTSGWLDVKASCLGSNPSETSVSFVRLIFDDATTNAPPESITDPEISDWVPPDLSKIGPGIAQRLLQKQASKLRKALKKAKKSGKKAKANRLKKKIKKLRLRIIALNN